MEERDATSGAFEAKVPKQLYRRHLQGAYVRAGASLVMWLSCLVAYAAGLVRWENVLSDTVAVGYLLLMNPPVLWVLRRINSARRAAYFSLFINLLEIVGYTAVLHSFGGIEATFLVLIYAALITYVGIVGTKEQPFVVAAMCSLAFFAMVALEEAGTIPAVRINPDYHLPWLSQLGIVGVNVILLFIVAFISSYTAQIIKKQRDLLESQNLQLRELLVRAQESDRLKSEFLANVSHELRTPLTAVIGYSELLKEGCFGPLNERQLGPVGDIFRSGRHLLSLIDDLLDLSRIAAGKMEAALAEAPLREILEEESGFFREEAAKKGIRLVAELEECPAKVVTDARKLRQIVSNLLSNAVKFTPEEGSVTLSVRRLRRDGPAWVAADGREIPLPDVGLGQLSAVNGDWLLIGVADTGIGLKKEDLERIFNPFEQVDGSLSRPHQGTGLGLAIVRRFIELLKGAAWAESEGEGRGSTFFVLLPLPGGPVPTCGAGQRLSA